MDAVEALLKRAYGRRLGGGTRGDALILADAAVRAERAGAAEEADDEAEVAACKTCGAGEGCMCAYPSAVLRVRWGQRRDEMGEKAMQRSLDVKAEDLLGVIGTLLANHVEHLCVEGRGRKR